MAADVSSLHRFMYNEENMTVGNDSGASKPTPRITRDLLGGGGGSMNAKDESQELDLDLQVPTGWEKCLDLKSGKVYLQRCNSPNSSSSSSSDHGRQHRTNQTVIPKLQDLNFPPSSSPSSKPFLLNLFDETSLELKLVSSSSASSSAQNYQSVCTLDKVKSALERAEKEQFKKRPSPSYSSSSSIKDMAEDESNEEEKLVSATSAPVAAGCPGCLSYVLIIRNDPKCPRCNTIVPMAAMKKPRIDLNMAI